ncbi:hypothetical protein D2E59_16800 [Mycobacteroides abscessus]|nr:hypothetical protein D2E48_20900 [Mycobacteroides abscessus]SHV50907.1 Uncharacterised protein [Mycobacteroides abscessus subsp. abscessus]SKE94148.1 Uncharacterised protein [Mycobacteroides abscessus subsp. massiliense]RIS70056.1 hypothetical protein D2E59_16800 [Mycobacteroides abscessus]RIU30419.1 hypothetical protein D2E96_20720 [Mycobacteroides abscessus]
MIATDRQIAAARGIVTAARNLGDGNAYVDACCIHTAGLSRDDLVAVIELLGGMLSIQFEGEA